MGLISLRPPAPASEAERMPQTSTFHSKRGSMAWTEAHALTGGRKRSVQGPNGMVRSASHPQTTIVTGSQLSPKATRSPGTQTPPGFQTERPQSLRSFAMWLPSLPPARPRPARTKRPSGGLPPRPKHAHRRAGQSSRLSLSLDRLELPHGEV